MFAMLAVLQWLDRLATAQCCLSSSLLVKHTSLTSPTSPTNQKMVACEYQLSGKPLGHIVMEDQADQADLVDLAGLRTASVLAKVSAMLEKLEIDHPARLLLVDQFTVMIGHAGPNMLDVCADQLSRAELLVIGPYRLPDHLSNIAATEPAKVMEVIGTQGGCQVYTMLIDYHIHRTSLRRDWVFRDEVVRRLLAMCVDRYAKLDGFLQRQYVGLLGKLCQLHVFWVDQTPESCRLFIELARIGAVHSVESVYTAIEFQMMHNMTPKQRQAVWNAGLAGVYLDALDAWIGLEEQSVNPDVPVAVLDRILDLNCQQVVTRVEHCAGYMSLLIGAMQRFSRDDPSFGQLVEKMRTVGAYFANSSFAELACRLGLLDALKGKFVRQYSFFELLAFLAKFKPEQVCEAGLLGDAVDKLAKLAKLSRLIKLHDWETNYMCDVFKHTAKCMPDSAIVNFVQFLSKHGHDSKSNLAKLASHVDSHCKALIDQVLADIDQCAFSPPKKISRIE